MWPDATLLLLLLGRYFSGTQPPAIRSAALEKTLAGQAVETEKVLDIIYQPQAVFRVRAVTRCTSSLEGHTEAVISVAFSPTGKYEGPAVGGACHQLAATGALC